MVYHSRELFKGDHLWLSTRVSLLFLVLYETFNTFFRAEDNKGFFKDKLLFNNWQVPFTLPASFDFTAHNTGYLLSEKSSDVSNHSATSVRRYNRS